MPFRPDFHCCSKFRAILRSLLSVLASVLLGLRRHPAFPKGRVSFCRKLWHGIWKYVFPWGRWITLCRILKDFCKLPYGHVIFRLYQRQGKLKSDYSIRNWIFSWEICTLLSQTVRWRAIFYSHTWLCRCHLAGFLAFKLLEIVRLFL